MCNSLLNETRIQSNRESKINSYWWRDLSLMLQLHPKDNWNYTVGKKYGSFNRVHHKHQMICQSRHLSPERKHSRLEFSSPSHWDFPRQEAPRCSHSSHWTSTPSLDWALLCSSHAWCRWCWVSLTWKRTFKCVLYVHHALLKLTKIVFPTSIYCDRNLLMCRLSL